MYEKLKDRIKQAMRDKDKGLLQVLRDMKNKIDLASKDGGGYPIDGLESIFQKMAKQRKQSIEAFEKVGNTEAADKEKFELGIIQEYLPKMMDDCDLEQAIRFLIYKNQYSGMKDMGKVMGDLKAKCDGRYDAGVASKMVKGILGK